MSRGFLFSMQIVQHEVLGGGRARSILGCETVEQCDAKEGFAPTRNPVVVVAARLLRVHININNRERLRHG